MIEGLDQQVKVVKEVIELPIKHLDIFEELSIAYPGEQQCWEIINQIGLHINMSFKHRNILGWCENGQNQDKTLNIWSLSMNSILFMRLLSILIEAAETGVNRTMFELNYHVIRG